MFDSLALKKDRGLSERGGGVGGRIRLELCTTRSCEDSLIFVTGTVFFFVADEPELLSSSKSKPLLMRPSAGELLKRTIGLSSYEIEFFFDALLLLRMELRLVKFCCFAVLESMEAENSLSKLSVSSLFDVLTRRSLSSLLRCCFSNSFFPRLTFVGFGSFKSLITCSKVSRERLAGLGLIFGFSALLLGESNVNSEYFVVLSKLMLNLLLSFASVGSWLTVLVLARSFDLESSSIKRNEDCPRFCGNGVAEVTVASSGIVSLTLRA